MLIAIDHGNYAIKTPRFSFVAGLSEHATKPPLADEVIEYGGSYWTLSGRRLPYMRDKTRDDRHFILSLFAIAKELLADILTNENDLSINVNSIKKIVGKHFNIKMEVFIDKLIK